VSAPATILSCWRPPFQAGAAETLTLPAGATLADIRAAFVGLPPDFDARGSILVGEATVPRRHWHRVRPKPGHVVTLHYALAGGGNGNSGKAVLGLVLAVATVLTAGIAAAGGFGFLSGVFAEGMLGAKLLGAGISLAGSLAASALSAPPVAARNPAAAERNRGAAALSGNLLGPGVPIPRVVGRNRRIYPALACQPIIERIGEDEFGEALFCLAGPHALSDIRAGDSAVDDAGDIEIGVREGWPDDPPLDLVARYGLTRQPNLELSGHDVETDAQDVLADQLLPELSLPQWHGTTVSAGADRLWLHLNLPQGMSRNANDSEVQAVPFRLRMRRAGDAGWVDLPEIWFAGVALRELRPTIELVWADAPEWQPPVGTRAGWIAAYKAVAGQAAPETAAWAAHASFSAGAGGDGLYREAEGATNVRRVRLGATHATFFLDEAEIPKGRWEVQVKRGAMLALANFSRSAYTYSGTARDFFAWVVSDGKARVVRSRENLSDRIYLTRAVSVFDRHPVKGGAGGSGLALIAVRVKNRALENLSVLASGQVRDWDGSGWRSWTTSSNPAVHYRDVLAGALTADPLEADLVDDAGLVEWRQACIDEGYTCDMVVEGEATQDLLTTIAGCGYARPRQSETWGVVRDRDRSAEAPSQIFTSRNSSGLAMAKAFPRLPDAFRVVWLDDGEDGAERQVIVWRRGRRGATAPRIEEVRYRGPTSEAAVTRRAVFDLAQAEARSAFWSWRAPAEAIRCTRGDLVAVSHDVIDRLHAAARLEGLETDGDGAIVGVTLDSPVPVYDEPDMLGVDDMLAVPDMALVGAATAVSIRRRDGGFLQATVSGGSGTRAELAFAAPVAMPVDGDDRPLVEPDALAWVGAPGREHRRMIVVSIDWDSDLVARITAVDEAPELWIPELWTA